MLTDADLSIAFNLPPEKAVEYFQAKGYAITWDWHEMLERAHDTAFTVAKCTQLDVLQTIRTQVDKIFTEGMTEAEFIKILEPKLKDFGWWGKDTYLDGNGEEVVYTKGSKRRLETIYQTNASVSYSTGRFNEQLENIGNQPYWEYVPILDSRTRPSHARLNGTVLRADDPFWQFYYPPNGWRCRCRVVAHSEAALARYGLKPVSSFGKLSQEIVYVGTDKRTGEARHTEISVFKDDKGREIRTDAGWNHNPAFNAYQPDPSKYNNDLFKAYQGLQ